MAHGGWSEQSSRPGGDTQAAGEHLVLEHLRLAKAAQRLVLLCQGRQQVAERAWDTPVLLSDVAQLRWIGVTPQLRQASHWVDGDVPLDLRRGRHAIVARGVLVGRVGGGAVLDAHRHAQIGVGCADARLKPAKEATECRVRECESRLGKLAMLLTGHVERLLCRLGLLNELGQPRTAPSCGHGGRRRLELAHSSLERPYLLLVVSQILLRGGKHPLELCDAPLQYVHSCGRLTAELDVAHELGRRWMQHASWPCCILIERPDGRLQLQPDLLRVRRVADALAAAAQPGARRFLLRPRLGFVICRCGLMREGDQSRMHAYACACKGDSNSTCMWHMHAYGCA